MKIKLKTSYIQLYLSALTVVYLMYALEGPIRFYSSKIGLPFLIYLKDLILFFIFFLSLVQQLKYAVIKKNQFIIYVLFLLFSVLGYYNGVKLVQIFFVYKIYLFFFLGIALYPLLKFENYSYLRKLFYFLAIISSLGLIINLFFKFPWEGAIMSVDGINLDVSRSAHAAGGFKRVAGFGRNWSNPAYICLIASVLSFSFLKKWNWKHVLLNGLIFLGLLVSTNKGVLFSYFLILIFLILKRFIPTFLFKVGTATLGLGVIILPLISWYNLISFYNLSVIQRIVFSSFLARMNIVWPEAQDLIYDYGSGFFGRGVGGIGASQIPFEYDIYNPADNLFIYLFGMFGFISLFILFYIMYKTVFLRLRGNKYDSFIFMMVIIFLGVGVIGSTLENSILNLFFGIMISALYYKKTYLPKILLKTRGRE